MAAHSFDQSNITWRTLDWLDHIAFFVYKVDEENRIVDVVFKFAANQRVMLHRHHCPYVTLVMQGELRFYRPSGRSEGSGGWGLGLALVRQIATLHGGQVRCEAPPEGGTTAWVVGSMTPSACAAMVRDFQREEEIVIANSERGHHIKG